MKHIVRLSLVGALLFLGGCLVSSRSSQHITGNFVSPSTFDQIEPGKTSASWVKATLGEPSSKQTADTGTEVWKYSYTERKDSSGAVFLIFGGSNTEEKQHAVYVEMKNGVVSKKWSA